MSIALVCWWHRAILRHEQTTVMNGETEPGVKCWRYVASGNGLVLQRLCRWFPSDGGHGR